LPGNAHPLYSRFLDLILAALLHLTLSPLPELEYVAEALWPIYTSPLPTHYEQTLLGRPYPNPDNPPDPLGITIKMLTDLKHGLTVPLALAAEELLTRKAGIEAMKDAAKRPLLPGTPSRTPSRAPANQGLSADLALCAKYLVVAGYCASYNPAKSDQRLFGRIGVDGKRKRGGGTRRAGYGRTRIGKVPQRLLGPKPFTLDRLLALFASLFGEHAVRPEDLVPGIDDGWSDADEEDGWRPSVDAAQRRAERIRQKELERDERWEEEVEHLTMSTRFWSMVSDRSLGQV
jgi:origin recognition complex subunit 5